MDDKRFVALLPENLQLKILSLVTDGEEVTANALPAQPPLPAQPALPESSAEPAAATLAGLQARVRTHGFGWQDAFVGAAERRLLDGSWASQYNLHAFTSWVLQGKLNMPNLIPSMPRHTGPLYSWWEKANMFDHEQLHAGPKTENQQKGPRSELTD